MPEERKPLLLDDKGSERNKLGTCAGFCECGTVPHRRGLCSAQDSWQPIASQATTEETKPVEREVTEVLADGTIVLMTKAAEKKWRKSIKSDINERRRLRREPAADAGPRQPCPHVNTMGHEWESHCLDCGEVWKHATPDYSVTTPVPQEAAPRLCTNCKEESWTHCRFHEPAHCHAECAQGTVPPWPTEQYPPRCKRVEPATSPDSAMRVARHFHETYERLAPEFGYETKPASAKQWEQIPENNRQLMIAVSTEVLALIRQAGSDEITKLRADYDREHKWLNDAASEANSDLDSVASVIRKLREAGSERERELRELDWDVLRQAADYLNQAGGGPMEDRLRLLADEASRLLGGESK